MAYDKESFLAGLAVGRKLWKPPQKPTTIFPDKDKGRAPAPQSGSGS